MGKTSVDAPAPAPTAAESYADWIKAYSQYAPERRTAELGDVDTQIAIAKQLAPQLLALQQQYGPQFTEETLKEVEDYGPRMQAATSDPTTERIRAALGTQIEGELGKGAALDAGLEREIEQGIRAGQSARGLIRGAAQITAEALMKGTQAEQLRRNRQAAATQFLQTQATTRFDPYTALTGKQTAMQMMPSNYQGVSQNAMQGTGLTQQGNLANQQTAFNTNSTNAMLNQQYNQMWAQLAGAGIGATGNMFKLRV